MRYIITYALLGASAVAALAEPNTGMESCKDELDNQKRLACFDALSTVRADASTNVQAKATITPDKVVLRIQRPDARKRIYNPRVELLPSFTNSSKKTAVALETAIQITDAFGDKIIDVVSKIDVKIPPGKTVESEQIYWWEDNQFIQGQPFDRLQGPVSTGAAKAIVTVTKAVFSDGSVESF